MTDPRESCPLNPCRYPACSCADWPKAALAQMQDGLTDDQQQAYAEYLTDKSELMIGNGTRLLHHIENGTYFDDFCEWWIARERT